MKITEVIYKGLSKKYNSGRKDYFLHASDLFNYCSRRLCYSYKLKSPYSKKEKNNLYGLFFTWAIGHKIEEIIFEALSEVTNKVKRKVVEKIKLIDDYYICFEIDIILDKYIIDVKSMNPESWEKEDIPYNYILQMQTYLWMAKLLKMPVNTDYGFLCCCKKTHDKYPIKMIKVSQNHNKIKEIVLDAQNVLKQFKNNQKLPERICKYKQSNMAKNCPFQEICFKEE